jgi:1-phosphatidylinositol-3-phosphate 5-kinase
MSTRPSSNYTLNTDITTLTSFEFNRPFEQDNENVISKLLQRVKSSFSTSNTTTNSSPTSSNTTNSSESLESGSLNTPPPAPNSKTLNSNTTSILLPDKENKGDTKPAPPVVTTESSFGNTPPEPDINGQNHTNLNGNGNNDSIIVKNGISSQHQNIGSYDPRHSLQFNAKDVSDTRSIRSVQTTASVGNSYSISKVIRRLRGEGVNKDYWMADDTCRECYDCKATFTMVRRKHHCRICGNYQNLCIYNSYFLFFTSTKMLL